jgi:molybdopterin converting factor small subunit
MLILKIFALGDVAVIRVKLHPALQKTEFKSKGYIQMQYEDGLTVEKLRELLKIQIAEVGFIVLNGKHAKNHDVLKRGDTIEFYPIFGGG